MSKYFVLYSNEIHAFRYSFIKMKSEKPTTEQPLAGELQRTPGVREIEL